MTPLDPDAAHEDAIQACFEMPSLTDAQRRVLSFLVQYIAQQGYPPTRQDICAALGFRSPNAAEEFLRALEKKGYIEIDAGISRGLRVK